MKLDVNNFFSHFSLSLDEGEPREANMERRGEDDLEVSKFYTNPITKPIPHAQPSPLLQDTISEFNLRGSGSHRNGLEASSEDISLAEDSIQEERDEELEAQKPPHPAGTMKFSCFDLITETFITIYSIMILLT